MPPGWLAVGKVGYAVAIGLDVTVAMAVAGVDGGRFCESVDTGACALQPNDSKVKAASKARAGNARKGT